MGHGRTLTDDAALSAAIGQARVVLAARYPPSSLIALNSSHALDPGVIAPAPAYPFLKSPPISTHPARSATQNTASALLSGYWHDSGLAAGAR